MTEASKGLGKAAEDAGKLSAEAASKLCEVTSEGADVANDAVDAGNAYAKDAVNVAGKKMGRAQFQLSACCSTVMDAIHREPVKAVVVTAVFVAALSALFLSLPRRSGSYYG